MDLKNGNKLIELCATLLVLVAVLFCLLIFAAVAIICMIKF